MQTVYLFYGHQPRTQIFQCQLSTLSHLQRIRQINHPQHLNRLRFPVHGHQYFPQQTHNLVKHVDQHQKTLLLPPHLLHRRLRQRFIRHNSGNNNNSSDESKHGSLLSDSF